MSIKLGDLQQLVMLAVVRLGDQAYGGAVQGELASVAERNVAVATVYVTLVRLEDHGLVESGSGPEQMRDVGRPRRARRRFNPIAPGANAARGPDRTVARTLHRVSPGCHRHPCLKS